MQRVLSLSAFPLSLALGLCALGCLAPPSAARLAQGVTPPADHLGRPVGVDFELADWGEVSSYFERLGAESPHVVVDRIGKTTEGRDFLRAVISSEANLARLDEIRAASHRLADPRGLEAEEREQLLEEGRVVLFVSCAMHATETAAPQFGMEFAWRLATSEEEPWRSAREHVVVVLFPSLNPDGQDQVVSWYRENVGTPYESTGLLELYQRYAGHDNNRDWFGLTQAETRIVTEQLYSVWRPQVYWDVHQQGRSRERFFVPPFRDPLNPNLDPGIIAGIGAVGGRALYDMTAEGLTGVSTGVTYDMWWNGGNRNVPVRHNIIGLLTEAASVNIASPVFLQPTSLDAPRGLGEYAPSNRFPAPWPGGWWRLRDIIDYELGFGRSLIGSLAREPHTWLAGSLAAAERGIEHGQRASTRAWLVPSDEVDRAAVRRLVDGLLLGGVEIWAAEQAFTADGREWPAGTLVLRRDQPYGNHLQDLFEVQRYPESGDAPYDVAGWTLPLLLGVRRVEVLEDFDVPVRRVADADAAVAGFPGRAGPGLDANDGDAWQAVWKSIAGGGVWSIGGQDSADRAGRLFERTAEGSDVDLRTSPRIGVYAPWQGSMDEGWLRWVFDTWGVPYQRVRNEMVRAGELDEFLDVLVVPSIRGATLDAGRSPGSVQDRYARGLDPEGAVAIEEFVRAGGTLITMSSSASWAIELFDLPLEDVTRGDDASEFSCPGSVLRLIPEGTNWTAGLADSLPIFFSRSSAWVESEDDEASEGDDEGTIEVLARYAPTRTLLSGWIREPEVIADKAAWVVARHGEGRVHLFGFRPQYRGWSQAVFPLLFRAILVL